MASQIDEQRAVYHLDFASLHLGEVLRTIKHKLFVHS